MKKHIVDGMVAVIIHDDWGPGWYTGWYEESMLYDVGLVELILARNLEDNCTEIQDYILKRWPQTHHINMFVEDISAVLSVEWVPEGAEFIIDNYDGMESVTLKDRMNFLKA